MDITVNPLRRFVRLSVRGVPDGVGLFLILILAGCQSGGPVSNGREGQDANLRTIGIAYAEATRSLGHPPRNREELLPSLQTHGDPKALLVSPVDGQPYVVLWEVDLEKGIPGSNEPVVLAYEQRGQSGNRFVLTALGPVTMTPSEFHNANFPHGHQPDR